MTDPTPPHRRSPMEHERDACPYCAEGALTIAHFQGVTLERERSAARIEALEAALSEWAGARASVVSGVVGTWERLAEAESRLARLNRKPPQ